MRFDLNKENLVVSFSGGETSAFMAQWLWKHKQAEYNMLFIFANTGEENEETLKFVEQCSQHFGFPVVWVEARYSQIDGVGVKYTVTNFKNAKRKGEPFEEHCKTYGIPNQASPSCSRDLKLTPILKYSRDWFKPFKFYTAVGIRLDEADRISEHSIKNRIVYPLISKKFLPTTKALINFYWQGMPFRLKLKGYQGNCKTCWKKGDKKLYQLAKEDPKQFDFFKRMEKTYGIYPRVGTEPVTFFRKNRSTEQILKEAKKWKGSVIDDSEDLVGGDSCEIFSNCGDL